MSLNSIVNNEVNNQQITSSPQNSNNVASINILIPTSTLTLISPSFPSVGSSSLDVATATSIPPSVTISAVNNSTCNSHQPMVIDAVSHENHHTIQTQPLVSSPSPTTNMDVFEPTKRTLSPTENEELCALSSPPPISPLNSEVQPSCTNSNSIPEAVNLNNNENSMCLLFLNQKRPFNHTLTFCFRSYKGVQL